MLKHRAREPSYSQLTADYEEAGIYPRGCPKIPGLPFGWTVLQFYECRCGHDRDAVILCQRVVEDGDHGTEFVVWWVNMIAGGCFNGRYTDSHEEATLEFNERRERLK